MLPIKTFKAALLFSMAIAVGCSGKGPTKYDEYFSEAHNNASKTGLKEHRDFNVPANKRPQDGAPATGIDDSLNLAMVGAAAMPGQVVADLGRSTTLLFSGLGIIESMLPKDVDYNTLMGWMPASMASSEQEAAEKYKEIFYNAIVATFPEEKGYQVVRYPEEIDNFVGAYIVNEEAGCPAELINDISRVCFARAFIHTPVLTLTPGAHMDDPRIAGHTEEYSYVLRYVPATIFSGSQRNAFDLLMMPDAQVNHLAASQALSYNLPEWMVLHVGHRSKPKIDGKKMPYAMQFRKGRALYFMKPLPRKKTKK